MSRQEQGPGILITGASRGIGREIARFFRSERPEARLALCARQSPELDSLSDTRSTIFPLDLSRREGSRSFIDRAAAELGGIDVLILNAAFHGVPHRDEQPAAAAERQRKVYDLNEVSPVILIDRALPHLRQSQGTVVFLTSGLARMPEVPPGAEEYASSKHTVESYVSELSADPRNDGVFFFSVSPGPVDTDMHRFIAGSGPEPLASLSRRFRDSGMLSDPYAVGRVIARMAISRMSFDPETAGYTLPIPRGSIVPVAPEAVSFELHAG